MRRRPLLYLAVASALLGVTHAFACNALCLARAPTIAPAMQLPTRLNRALRKGSIKAIRAERVRRLQLEDALEDALKDAKRAKEHLKSLSSDSAARRGGILMRARLAASKQESELLSRAEQLRAELMAAAALLAELEAAAAA